MASELGPSWQSRFQSFEHTAAAAASLGQVHKAIGPTGGSLLQAAISDMASAVEADLRQLGLIFAIFERTDSAISTARSRRKSAPVCARSWITSGRPNTPPLPVDAGRHAGRPCAGRGAGAVDQTAADMGGCMAARSWTSSPSIRRRATSWR
ncbi:AarF/UbiB family protein [Azospirillum sp. INR13]|uniref:AarF/UbiB family protein n=1 Tax=Azospirillum sp. INR13 TaxID=2596919 RepID=UPI00351BFED7